MEELKYPQEIEERDLVFFDDLNEKVMNDHSSTSNV